MDISVLQLFIDICEFGSFSTAATKNYLSHQALSKKILNLEKDLGVQLLVRSSRGVVPTEAGRILLQGAKQVTNTWNLTESKLQKLSFAELKGSISIGFSYDAEYLMAVDYFENNYLKNSLVEELRGRFPKVMILSGQYPYDILEKRILSRDIDIGFTVSPVDETKFQTHIMFTAPMVVSLGRKNHLSGKNPLLLSDLCDENIIIPDERLKIRNSFLSIMEKNTSAKLHLTSTVALEPCTTEIAAGKAIYLGRLLKGYSISQPELIEKTIQDAPSYNVISFSLKGRNSALFNVFWNYLTDSFTQHLVASDF